MLVIALEISLLLGTILLPLVPRKRKSLAAVNRRKKKPMEMSNYVVTVDGDLEELIKPHDSSLFQ